MICRACGIEVSASDTTCRGCGQQLSPSTLAASHTLRSSSLMAAEASLIHALTEPITPNYAGFWVRFLASFIDGLIAFVVFLLLVFPLFFLTPAASEPPDPTKAALFGLAILGLYLIAIVGAWLYEALMESSRWQATLGKRALGLRVVDLEGRHISFGRATGRHFAKILSGMILNIGFLMAGFTSKKQALHDMIAGTLVVRR